MFSAGICPSCFDSDDFPRGGSGHVTGSRRQPQRRLSYGGQCGPAGSAQRKWQSKTSVINASISGDTSQQGLSRLPALLKQHQPRWVLVELGGNDGLRGFQPQQTEQTLRTILKDIKAANAQPLLMQIRLPANYGRRYNEAFSAIYPKLANEFDIPLLPFFMEEVYLKPNWMQDDGIHPNRDAQPFIADWMATRLAPLVNHDS